MTRRDFISLVGSAVALPLAARAQQTRMPTIGVLALGNPPVEPFLKDLRDGLQEAGYVEGRNIRLEIRSAGAVMSRLPELAAELVRFKVDAIVAYQTPSATAAKQATGDIPIVMAGVGDPVGTGLVASLPGQAAMSPGRPQGSRSSRQARGADPRGDAVGTALRGARQRDRSLHHTISRGNRCAWRAASAWRWSRSWCGRLRRWRPPSRA